MDPSFLRAKHAREVRSSRLKLFLMLVLLIGVVYAMVRLSQRYGGGEEGGAPGRPIVGRKVSRERPDIAGIDPAAGGKPPDPLEVADEEVARKFEFLKDPATLELIEDQSTELEPAPFFFMLYRVFRETFEELEAEAKETGDVPWQALWEEPAAHRGEAIAVTGRIVRIWPQPLGQNPMGLDKVMAYRIRAKRGAGEGAPEGAERGPLIRLYDVYAIEPLHGALPHDHVTTTGRFLKAQTIPPEPERLFEDPDLHVAVVIARRFEPLTYLEEPEPPGPIVDGNRPEARAFYWFLHQAIATPKDQLHAQATDPLTYVDLTTQPQRYRGTPIALTGELRNLRRQPLPEDNPLDLAEVFYGQILDRDMKMNTFYVHQIPDGIRLKDEVVVFGYFMKTWEYTSRDNRIIESPLVVGKHLARVTFEEDYTFEIALAALAGLTLLVLLVAYQRERARQAAVDEARRQRQLARMPKDISAAARRLTGRGEERPHEAEPSEQPPQDDSRDAPEGGPGTGQDEDPAD